MIEVEKLTKYYGRVPAVEDIAFRVEKGEILGFLGPNGAGKTTTMRILTCYLPASSGTAKVAGFDVFENSMDVRRRIGYLPEHPPLYNEMTVRSYMKYVARIKGVPSSERKKRFDVVKEQCAIGEVWNTVISKLSKGYRQRVGLAQALIHDPEVLILDEPTVGLDPKQIIEVRELIKDLAGEHTIILSTHILPEVEMTCQRVVIINRGRIVAEDTPEKLVSRLKGANTLFLKVEGPPEDVLNTIRAIQDVSKVSLDGVADENQINSYLVESQITSDIRAQVASRIVAGNFSLREMRPVELRLEDIFLQLTAEES